MIGRGGEEGKVIFGLLWSGKWRGDIWRGSSTRRSVSRFRSIPGRVSSRLYTYSMFLFCTCVVPGIDEAKVGDEEVTGVAAFGTVV